MESIGETLRAARHERQASISDAARVTKIKPDILEQLEGDDFSRIAAPAYTKAFLKLYAEYLGLNSQQIVDAYVSSQGGMRRQGLAMETEATARARKPRELQLPLRRVVAAVAGVTLLVVLVLAGRNFWNRRTPAPARAAGAARLAMAAPNLPKADFEAYYQPKTKAVPELLEMPAKER